jgi:hypothetical protein
MPLALIVSLVVVGAVVVVGLAGYFIEKNADTCEGTKRERDV